MQLQANSHVSAPGGSRSMQQMRSAVVQLRHRAGAVQQQQQRTLVAAQAAETSTIVEPALDTSKLKNMFSKGVLVAGATGGVGRKVVDVLVEQGVPVRALARDVTKAKSLLPGVASGAVEVVQGDVFQFSSLPRALGDAQAIIVATGSKDITDPLGPFNVDYQGAANLVALAQQKKLSKFVLVTSIGTDDLLNPLNLFWGVLFWKKRGEEALQRSGVPYTIVRPGGLKDKTDNNEPAGNLLVKPAGFYGVPPKGKAGSILRRQVAEVCVASLYEKEAAGKVLEIIAEKDAPIQSYADLFAGVQ